MMIEKSCEYANRDEVIVSYLYDDLDDVSRVTFDAHLSVCSVCRGEIGELRAVRRQLQKWEAPAVVSSLQPPVRGVQRQTSWWQEIPMWARAAAAVVCIGAAAGLANIDVRYNQEGFTVRTGWLTPSMPTSATAAPASALAGGDGVVPWRADLAALERQLRNEFRSESTQPMAVASATPAMSETELLRRVRQLVQESERKQERELALRVGQVLRSVDAQRQADLRRIDNNLGLIQNNTGAEVMRQRQMLINYLSRVSAQK